jgi:hypothetical protein
MVEPLHSRRKMVLRFLALLRDEGYEERVQGRAVFVVHAPGGRGV